MQLHKLKKVENQKFCDIPNFFFLEIKPIYFHVFSLSLGRAENSISALFL